MNAPARIAALTTASLKDLIPKMAPGQALIYHVGSLMFDRTQPGPYSRLVDEIATAAWDAHQRGEVTLVQHKIGLNKFEYVAVKKAPRNAAKVLGHQDGRNKPARRPQDHATPALVEVSKAGTRHDAHAVPDAA